MDKASVAYVLCRIEDDSSLTPVSEHEDIVAGVAAGKHRVEVEVFDFSYGLYVDGGRVASFAEGRIGYREWATRRSGRINPRLRGSLRPRNRRAYGMILWLLQDGVPMRSAPAFAASRDVCTTWSVVRGWLASDAQALGGWWSTSTHHQRSKTTHTLSQGSASC